jgi:hypothetical protein
MKRLSAIVALVAFAVLLVPQAASLAATSGGGTSASCTLTFVERFSPGFTLTPSSGDQDSAVETGTVMCSGTVNGHKLTGPGTFWNRGRYSNSTCLIDRATGSYFLTLQTDAGPVVLDGTFVVERLATVLKVTTEAPGVSGEGSALVVPTKGDCVLTPVTEALVVMSIAFRETQVSVERSCDLDAGVILINCRIRS